MQYHSQFLIALQLMSIALCAVRSIHLYDMCWSDVRIVDSARFDTNRGTYGPELRETI